MVAGVVFSESAFFFAGNPVRYGPKCSGGIAELRQLAGAHSESGGKKEFSRKPKQIPKRIVFSFGFVTPQYGIEPREIGKKQNTMVLGFLLRMDLFMRTKLLPVRKLKMNRTFLWLRKLHLQYGLLYLMDKNCSKVHRLLCCIGEWRVYINVRSIRRFYV